jgi:hypothetical protein
MRRRGLANVRSIQVVTSCAAIIATAKPTSAPFTSNASAATMTTPTSASCTRCSADSRHPLVASMRDARWHR